LYSHCGQAMSKSKIGALPSDEVVSADSSIIGTAS
jgi:hypothetical protein